MLTVNQPWMETETNCWLFGDTLTAERRGHLGEGWAASTT